MLYYRFRPYSELTLKELLYSEMYFSSPEECNDPFDSKTFYTFSRDKEKWVNLILLALDKYRPRPQISGEQLKKFTEHFCKKCPLTFDDIITGNPLTDFKARTTEEKNIKDLLSTSIPKIVELYRPSTRYFVSFSKEPNEPLMWAHYADKHKGFCLIFRALNGGIKQFEFRKKHQITRQTPDSFAVQMSYLMPEQFNFFDIEYLPKVIQSSAFFHLPVAVSGEVENEEHRGNIRAEQESHYKQKGKSWEYEKESRLILSPPASWLFGEHIEYTKQERLFHYDPSHLVGIICGAKMKTEEKKRIQDILSERREWNIYYPEYNRIEFSFMEFEAELSTTERDIKIKPIAINAPNRTFPSDKDFERLYGEWLEGRGFEKNGRNSRRVKVT